MPRRYANANRSNARCKPAPTETATKYAYARLTAAQPCETALTEENDAQSKRSRTIMMRQASVERLGARHAKQNAFNQHEGRWRFYAPTSAEGRWHSSETASIDIQPSLPAWGIVRTLHPAQALG